MSEYWPLIIVAVIIGYTIAHRRLQRAAQPLRLELAERGSALLSREGVSEDVKRFVTFLLDHAFSFRGSLLAALVVIPILGLWIALAAHRIELPFKDASPDVRKALFDLSQLHDRIIKANHPLLATLVDLEVVLLVVPAALIAAVFRGHLSARNDKDDILTLLEAKEAKVLAYRRAA